MVQMGKNRKNVLHRLEEKIIFDGYKQMREQKAFLWGVSTSQNARHMKVNGVS